MAEFQDLYGKITDRIVADLEKGVRPWIMPPCGSPGPCATTAFPTRGINVLMLWSASVTKGYDGARIPPMHSHVRHFKLQAHGPAS